MENWTEFEGIIRLSVFAGVLILFSALEFIIPRKDRRHTRLSRWTTNVALLAVSTVFLRIILPVATISFAMEMGDRRMGLFNLIALPVWLEVVIAIVLLDFAIWFQHMMMHYIPPLWAFHKVHHADEDLDASSGLRFHPLEMVFSFGFKLAVIALLGVPALGIFLFEVILNAASIFEHASIRIPKKVDRALRKVIVTPDMHRVHHSVHMQETNSNFGFCLSIWDRIFRTYCAEPREGHEAMELGLDRRPPGNAAGLWWALSAPFRTNQAARTQSGSSEA